jgi:hypothetical protein
VWTFSSGALICSTAFLLSATGQSEDLQRDFERQLLSRYAPVKLSPHGQTILAPGSVLTVRVPGIAANPANQFTFSNSFQNGRIKQSAGSRLITDKNTTIELRVGEGVYLYKVTRVQISRLTTFPILKTVGITRLLA